MTGLNGLFSMILALLFTHEMDAVRNKEWRMFIGLKDLPEETAYRLFLLLHIPLYTAVLLVLINGTETIGFYLVDLFMIFHAITHYLFRNHPNNRLTNRLSQGIINAAGALALIHLILFHLW